MNTINNINCNTTFQARYLKINDDVPQAIKDAVYRNDSIEAFLFESNKKKSLFQMFLDSFRKNEVLEVSYFEDTYKGSKDNSSQKNAVKKCDPFKKDFVTKFLLHKEGCKKGAKEFRLTVSQEGVMRSAGSIPKPGEHPVFKQPAESAEDKMVKQIESLSDLESRLA